MYTVLKSTPDGETTEQVETNDAADARLNEIAGEIMAAGNSLVRLQMLFTSTDGVPCFIEMVPD